jgi:hypothetical protein
MAAMAATTEATTIMMMRVGRLIPELFFSAFSAAAREAEEEAEEEVEVEVTI